MLCAVVAFGCDGASGAAFDAGGRATAPDPAMVHVVEATPMPAWWLHVRFDDGTEGDVDVAEMIAFDGVFAALREPSFFARVFVNPDWGTVCWPGDLDLAPEPFYERITGHKSATGAW